MKCRVCIDGDCHLCTRYVGSIEVSGEQVQDCCCLHQFVIEFRRAVCNILGHRWVQPEGVFTKRWCDRCGVLPHAASGRRPSDAG